MLWIGEEAFESASVFVVVNDYANFVIAIAFLF